MGFKRDSQGRWAGSTASAGSSFRGIFSGMQPGPQFRQRRDPATNLRVTSESDGPEGRTRAYSRRKPVGELVYHVNESYFPERTMYPDQLDVDAGHRGRGIATALHGAALRAHPDLSMTHTVEGMSPDAKRALSRFQFAHPGRHKVYDDATEKYVG